MHLVKSYLKTLAMGMILRRNHGGGFNDTLRLFRQNTGQKVCLTDPASILKTFRYQRQMIGAFLLGQKSVGEKWKCSGKLTTHHSVYNCSRGDLIRQGVSGNGHVDWSPMQTGECTSVR